MNRLCCVFCALFWWATSATAESCERINDADIVGTAYDKKGERLYCEYHFVDEQEDVSVRYINQLGELIAEKQVVSGSSPQRPSIYQVDLRSGEVRSAEVVSKNKRADEVKVEYKKNKEAEPRHFAVSVVPNLVIDAGFDVAIRQSLAMLSKGERLKFTFLSLMNGKSYSLNVKTTRLSRCQPENINDNYQCFVVKPANSVARLFVTPIYLLYDVVEEKLLRFSGQVNLLSDAGESQKAVIRYQHF